MDSLSETVWDVVISGTGLAQSLLALALSRSGKKILHVDKNDFYGGLEAALSLQEAEVWVNTVNEAPRKSPFLNANISRSLESDESQAAKNDSALAFSRAYSLSLAPQVIYTRSTLLPTLVSSKVYRQLDFLAIGSWWLYEPDIAPCNDSSHPSTITPSQTLTGNLRKIPSGREDIVNDESIDLKSKHSLMKFLKIARNAEAQTQALEKHGNQPFPEYLSSEFGISSQLQSALLALALSPGSRKETLTSYALPRVIRHLTSIGVFGPGFGSVIPKWGGIAEISQVACRASAVGGAVYVLDRSVDAIFRPDIQIPSGSSVMDDTTTLRLHGGEEIRTHFVIGSQHDLPVSPDSTTTTAMSTVTRMISIVASPLQELFPAPSDGAPPPAGAVVVFPEGSLTSTADSPPVYLTIHTSDSGECPTGQCVVYASIWGSTDNAADLLNEALSKMLRSVHEDSLPAVLWSMRYTQEYPTEPNDSLAMASPQHGENVISLPMLDLDLAFNDGILERVKVAWQRVTGETDGFMQFDDREVGAYDDNDDADG